LFQSAVMLQDYFTTCRFEEVSFERADLRDTVISGPAGTDPCEYRRVSFARADLRHTFYGYPLFEDCDFSHSKFAGIHFDGSRFIRCKFAGKMGETWFFGWYPPIHEADKEWFVRRGIDPTSFRNTMEDIDFT